MDTQTLGEINTAANSAQSTGSGQVSALAIAMGQEFESFSHFKKAVHEWVVSSSFVVRIAKSDTRRVAFSCYLVNCIFRVAAWWRKRLGKVLEPPSIAFLGQLFL